MVTLLKKYVVKNSSFEKVAAIEDDSFEKVAALKVTFQKS